MGIPRELQELLEKMGGNVDVRVIGDNPKKAGSWDVSILPEAQIETLLEIHKAYRNGRKLKPGDVVTPVRYCGTKGTGNPMVVVEVRDSPEPSWGQEGIGSAKFGAVPDVRIAMFCDNEEVRLFWGESWEYIPYSN